MAAALRNGEVDAAWMVEPFITHAEKELGARILADGTRGATLDFPVSGYASSGIFAQGTHARSPYFAISSTTRSKMPPIRPWCVLPCRISPTSAPSLRHLSRWTPTRPLSRSDYSA
jgi:hypothetical protein